MIDDRYDDLRGAAGVFLPDGLNVDVYPFLEGAPPTLVDEVPLLFHVGIIENRLDLLSRLEHHVLDAREGGQAIPRLGAGDVTVVADPVPAVQPGGAVPRFEFPGFREQALYRADAQLLQQFGVGGGAVGIGCFLGEQQNGLARDRVRDGNVRVGWLGFRLLNGAVCEQRQQGQQDIDSFSHGSFR